jgi:hypothetical protein
MKEEVPDTPRWRVEPPELRRAVGFLLPGLRRIHERDVLVKSPEDEGGMSRVLLLRQEDGPIVAEDAEPPCASGGAAEEVHGVRQAREDVKEELVRDCVCGSARIGVGHRCRAC